MTVATYTEVFDFMSTDDSLRSGNSAMITALISSSQKMIEDYIGRLIELEEDVTISIHDGRYCDISGKKIFLNGKYSILFRRLRNSHLTKYLILL